MTASDSTLKSTVKEKYGQAALRVSEGATAAPCCGSSGCCGATTEAWDPITSDLYDEKQKAGIPVEAVLASLGCGNPTALAALKEGETVLDLGSGGGIDVLLSAKRVGPTGKAYGLDMTDEMLALAQRNARRGRDSQRDLPEGPDRGHSPPGRLGRCGDLELRDQSLDRQGASAERGLSSSEARRQVRGIGCRRSR